MGFMDVAKETEKNLQDVWEIRTSYDEIIDEVKKGTVNIKDLSKNLKFKNLKNMLELLEKQDLIEIIYPTNPLKPSTVKLKERKEKIRKGSLPTDKELKEDYEISSDFVKAQVKIWKSPREDVPMYEIVLPKIPLGTRAFLDHMINKIAKSEIQKPDHSDNEKYINTKRVFMRETKKMVKDELNIEDESTLNLISGKILHEMYGLGDMEVMMNDNWLEEVAINGAKAPVSVYHKRYGWAKSTFYLESDREIYNMSSQIGRKVGRQINNLNPLMDAHLVSGDRVASTISPISTSGNTITIRRFSRNPWTITHLVDDEVGTMSVDIAAFLWLCMQYELNVMIAGGTASGKTSALNSIASLIPTTQRIISIEDTREISLPKELEWNWIPLASRKANPEGKGEVTMLDLMVESLRMRPDRIVVGEVRRREQAETLFETMHTGHSVYATIHADTVEQVEKRLIEPPIQIPKSEIGALQLIIVQYRDRRTGKRRTLEVAEILSQETEGKNLTLNYLYRWKPREDKFEKINESIRVMEDLNLHTGMTANDIKEDLEEKQSILQWMVDNKIKDVDTVGNIVKLYYRDKKRVIDAARKNKKPKELFEK